MNKAEETLELLERPVDIRKLISNLMFNLDGFEEANIRQPRLYLEAARYLTWAVLEKAMKETRLETMLAEAGLKLRETKANGTKKGMTEKAIADSVITDPEIKKYKKKFILAKVTEVWAKQLVEAYNHRLQVLNNISKVRSGEMASELRVAKERAAINTMRKEADRVRQGYER